ncbi:hypothetical protein KDA11_02550 [Candidatus Saccharibacteria bacterium]|nr:hypothetical protein [Candidatus Saccharibacteria bacterium]
MNPEISRHNEDDLRDVPLSNQDLFNILWDAGNVALASFSSSENFFIGETLGELFDVVENRECYLAENPGSVLPEVTFNSMVGHVNNRIFNVYRAEGVINNDNVINSFFLQDDKVAGLTCLRIAMTRAFVDFEEANNRR